jgi:hypothetical protein
MTVKVEYDEVDECYFAKVKVTVEIKVPVSEDKQDFSHLHPQFVMDKFSEMDLTTLGEALYEKVDESNVVTD